MDIEVTASALCRLHTTLDRRLAASYEHRASLAHMRRELQNPTAITIAAGSAWSQAENLNGWVRWRQVDSAGLTQIDSKRITEDAAEAVALAFVAAAEGWRLKRRLDQAEGGDFLLEGDGKLLVLEVSGVDLGSPTRRARDKEVQVARGAWQEGCLLGAVVYGVGAQTLIATKPTVSRDD